MNKVFSITIIPATRRSKEWIIASVAPGVPLQMVATNHASLSALAEKRGADLTFIKDADVKVVTLKWWQRWAARKAFRKLEPLFQVKPLKP